MIVDTFTMQQQYEVLKATINRDEDHPIPVTVGTFEGRGEKVKKVTWTASLRRHQMTTARMTTSRGPISATVCKGSL